MEIARNIRVSLGWLVCITSVEKPKYMPTVCFVRPGCRDLLYRFAVVVAAAAVVVVVVTTVVVVLCICKMLTFV